MNCIFKLDKNEIIGCIRYSVLYEKNKIDNFDKDFCANCTYKIEREDEYHKG